MEAHDLLSGQRDQRILLWSERRREEAFSTAVLPYLGHRSLSHSLILHGIALLGHVLVYPLMTSELHLLWTSQ